MSAKAARVCARELEAIASIYAMQLSARWNETAEAANKIQSSFASLRTNIPTFAASLQRAREFAKEVGRPADEQRMRDQIALLVQLAQRLEAVATGVPSLYAENGRPAELRWEHYADRVLQSIDTYAPGLGVNEKRRFMVAIVPYLTGEQINEDTVKNAKSLGNIPSWPAFDARQLG